MTDDKPHKLGEMLRDWCVTHGVYAITARLNQKERAETWKVSLQGHKHSTKDASSFSGAMMAIEEVLGAPPAHPDVRELDSAYRYRSEFFGLEWTCPGLRGTRSFVVEPAYGTERLHMLLELQLTVVPASVAGRRGAYSRHNYIRQITFTLQSRQGIAKPWETLTQAECSRTDDPGETLRLFLSSAALTYGSSSGMGSFCENLLEAMAKAAADAAHDAAVDNEENDNDDEA